MIVINRGVAGGLGVVGTPISRSQPVSQSTSMSNLTDYVRNMSVGPSSVASTSVAGTPTPTTVAQFVANLGATGADRNTSSCTKGEFKCHAQVPQYIVDYINNLPVAASGTSERCAMLKTLSVIGTVSRSNKKICYNHTRKFAGSFGLLTNGKNWAELLDLIQAMMPGKNSTRVLEALQMSDEHFIK